MNWSRISAAYLASVICPFCRAHNAAGQHPITVAADGLHQCAACDRNWRVAA